MAETNAIGESAGNALDLLSTPVGSVVTALVVTVIGGLIIHRLTRSRTSDIQPPKSVEVTVKTESAPPPAIAEPTANQIITVPRPNANYTGRAEKLDEVTAALGSGHIASIVSLGGMGGVGKTETAQVIAHRLLSEGKYPDGAVMLDLQGFSETGQMVETSAAIIRLFGQLKKPLGAPPENISEADYAATLGEMWRAETTGKDMLVILDNARDAEQARPLLPGAGATVLVTSRERIDLADVREVTLDRLDDADALALIRTLCPDLGAEDQGAFLDMADGLPLLIEVAAPVIAAKDGRAPAAKIAAYAEVGAREEGAAALRARLALSLKAMAREEAELFSGLSQFEGGFFAHAAGLMWGEEQADAERRLAAYAKRNLVIAVEAPLTEMLGARWRLHDHLRRVAADWLKTASNQTALRHGWGRASLTMMQLAGEMYDRGAKEGEADWTKPALALLDAELPNIRAVAAGTAAHAASDDVAADVAMRLPNPAVLNLRLTPTERIKWLLAGVPGAKRLNEPAAEAALLGNAGYLLRILGKSVEAERYLKQSLEISEEEELKEFSANQYGNLGILYATRGDLDQAEEMYRKSLALEEALGRKEGMASDYGNLGNLYRTRGDLGQAEEMYRKALDLNEALGRNEGMASNYGNLGSLYQTRGDLDQAEEMYRKALALDEALGRKGGMAIQNHNIAILRLQQSRAAEAMAHAETALALFRKVGMAPEAAQAEKMVDKIRKSI